MDIKEAFKAINEVVVELTGRIAPLVLAQSGFVICGKYENITFNYKPWDDILKNGLTVEVFKPIAKEVFEMFCADAKRNHADYKDEDPVIAQEAQDGINNDIEWARKVLGILLI